MFMVEGRAYKEWEFKNVDYKIRLSKKVKNGKIDVELFASKFAKEQNKKAPPGFVKMTI